jgi:hypothetical protein
MRGRTAVRDHDEEGEQKYDDGPELQGIDV